MELEGEKMTPFREKLRAILKARKIPLTRFDDDTGIDRANFFYRKGRQASHKHCRYIYMAIAYYLDMTVEELIEGTDAEIDWYGDADM